MSNLEATQERVAQLYYEARDNGDECCHVEHTLKERIRKHLRLVLCDIIILRKIGEDTIVDDD